MECIRRFRAFRPMSQLASQIPKLGGENPRGVMSTRGQLSPTPAPSDQVIEGVLQAGNATQPEFKGHWEHCGRVTIVKITQISRVNIMRAPQVYDVEQPIF